METGNWYVEYAVGSIANRMHLCKVNELGAIVAKNIGKEIYRSMFLYDVDILDHVKKNNTVSDYKGVQAVDKIVLDIDLQGESRGDQALESVKVLIEELKERKLQEEHINVWFSGRGFHIHIPNIYNFEPSKNLSKVVRATMQRDFGKHIDLIYDGRRLIRAGYSFNNKTNCYKIPLTLNELDLWDYAKIKEFASEIRTDYKPETIQFNEDLGLVPMDVSRKNSEEHRKVFKDAKTETSRWITCTQHIYNAGEVKGHRHKNLLRLASLYIRQYGHDQRAVDALARAYMSKFDNPLPADEVSRIVADCYKAGGYKYTCYDDVLTQFCDPKCTLYRFKNLEESSDVLTAEQMIENLIEYVNTDFTDKSFDLRTMFPYMENPYEFRAGQLAMLIGATKLGKTAFWQYVVAMQKKVKTLFLSLEVDQETMTRRFLQIVLNQHKGSVTDGLRKDESGNVDPEIVKKCIDGIKHIKLLTSSPDITAYTELIQEHKPKILVVDTIDMVPARYSKKDEYDRIGDVTIALKKLAIEQEIIVLGVSHISRSASYRLKDGEQMDVNMAKANSTVENKADKIIGFNGDNRDTKKRRIMTLGSRDETGFDITCNYDWETFTFSKRN